MSKIQFLISCPLSLTLRVAVVYLLIAGITRADDYRRPRPRTRIRAA
jgi:hypothetical protein